MKKVILLLVLLWPALGAAQSLSIAETIASWQIEFPKGDFDRLGVPPSEIEFDGNTRDSIPPVFDPVYENVSNPVDIGAQEPVLSVEINGDARAYPLRILLWHEIVNETIGGKDVLVSYCPLCNSGVVFSREVDGQTLTFGNTCRIRHLDMVMYDHQTESWWQQFNGTAIIGSLLDQRMQAIPARQESYQSFKDRNPQGQVLVPSNARIRPYGDSPFANMERMNRSQRFNQWPLPEGIQALDYVVVVGSQAWPLQDIVDGDVHNEEGLQFNWTPGRNSLHDKRNISRGRDIGQVEVLDRQGDLVAHDLVFAFAFSAFNPQGEWMR